MAVSTKSKIQPKQQASGDSRIVMPFSKENYILMILCIALISAAFTLMALENEVDGWIALWLAPYMLVGGYAGLAFAILYRKKQKSE
ncbi:MAG: DUF3098 domain-containing protein [Bacteroidetes bacterium]|nr:DUF3098 domain-containing protein [Bacteroidota bacterium]